MNRYEKTLFVSNRMGIHPHDSIECSYSDPDKFLENVKYYFNGDLVGEIDITNDSDGNVLSVTRTL